MTNNPPRLRNKELLLDDLLYDVIIKTFLFISVAEKIFLTTLSSTSTFSYKYCMPFILHSRCFLTYVYVICH